MITDVEQYLTKNPLGGDFSQDALNKALVLVKEAVQDERHDELLYDYLIQEAPTEEEKEIIRSIRDDERTHRNLFKEIYKEFTGDDIDATDGDAFTKPDSYIAGVKSALFGELAAMEKYRVIREGIPSRWYRDVVFRILTDEMKHADKYNYILNINTSNRRASEAPAPQAPAPETPMPRNINTVPRPAPRTNPAPFVMASSYMQPDGFPPGALHRRASFTLEEALELAREIGVDFQRVRYTPEEFRLGLEHELNHRRRFSPDMSIEPLTLARAVTEQLNEIPDYYTRLRRMISDARRR
ncbi:MAG: DUF5661 family protein [Christensenellales bacterium]|jgi:rubrerythrin